MKRKPLIIICSVVILLGVVLLLATPAGIVFIIGGIVGIIYAVRKKPEPEPRPRSQRPASPQTVTVSPSRRSVMSRTFNVAGVTCNCSIDPEYSRQDVFARAYEGEALNVEEYQYKGAPALLLVEPLQDLDIGNVPADLVAEIVERFPENELEAYIVNIDSFFPDDRDEEITTCKVKIYVLE